MNTITPATVEEHEPGGPLDGAIASFLKQLQEAGYAKKSLRDKRAVVRTFADWLRRRHITVHAINESHVAAFLKRKPGTLPPRLKYRSNKPKPAACFGSGADLSYCRLHSSVA